MKQWTVFALVLAAIFFIAVGPGMARVTYSPTSSPGSFQTWPGVTAQSVLLSQASGLAGIWLANNTAAPTTSNYSLFSDGTNTFVNAPSGSQIGLRINNADQLDITSTHVTTPNLHSTTGTRFLCVDTSGNFIASATACSGT